MLDLKKLLTKMLQELKYAKLNTSEYVSSPGNTVSFTQDVNTGQISVSSQAITITPNQISGTIPANKVNISVPTAGTAKPKAVGTSAVVGTATTWSKSDHVHNITGNTINSALGYTPYDSSNPDGFGKITEIISSSPIVGSGTTGTITLSHSASGVTSGVYGSTADQSPTFGSSVIVPNFNVNNTGHLTTASTSNIIIPSNTFTAATTAVEGNVGLVPATSTATTEKFDGTTGLSNYWLNANGTWSDIPYSTFDTNTRKMLGGLITKDQATLCQILGSRGFWHAWTNSEWSIPTGSNGGFWLNNSITNNTSNYNILYKITFSAQFQWVYGDGSGDGRENAAVRNQLKEDGVITETGTDWYDICRLNFSINGFNTNGTLKTHGRGGWKVLSDGRNTIWETLVFDDYQLVAHNEKIYNADKIGPVRFGGPLRPDTEPICACVL